MAGSTSNKDAVLWALASFLLAFTWSLATYHLGGGKQERAESIAKREIIRD